MNTLTKKQNGYFIDNIIVIEEIGHDVTIGFVNSEGELEYNTYMHKDGGIFAEDFVLSGAEKLLIETENIADEHEVIINTIDPKDK